MHVIAGCDGGGSKTIVRMRLIDELGNTLREGSGQGGPANVATDRARALENIAAATQAARQQVQLQARHTIDVFVAALAGAGRPAEQQAAAAGLQPLLSAKRLEVVPDIASLLAASGLCGPCLALIVGTGSIAWIRDEQDVIHRFGGWGPRVGDEGSGYWIGWEAIKSSLRSHFEVLRQPPLYRQRDGGQEPRETDPLVSHVLQQLAAPSKQSLLSLVYSGALDTRRVAALAPIVFSLSAASEMAASIVKDATAQISRRVTTATQTVFGDSSSLELPWICGGSVIVHQETLRQQIRQASRTRGRPLGPPLLIANPVEGALRLAAQLR